MPLLKTLRTKVVPAKAARPSGPGSAMNIVGFAGMGLSPAVVVRPWSRSMLWLDMECFLSSPAGQARAQAGWGGHLRGRYVRPIRPDIRRAGRIAGRRRVSAVRDMRSDERSLSVAQRSPASDVARCSHGRGRVHVRVLPAGGHRGRRLAAAVAW